MSPVINSDGTLGMPRNVRNLYVGAAALAIPAHASYQQYGPRAYPHGTRYATMAGLALRSERLQY